MPWQSATISSSFRSENLRGINPVISLIRSIRAYTVLGWLPSIAAVFSTFILERVSAFNVATRILFDFLSADIRPGKQFD